MSATAKRLLQYAESIKNYGYWATHLRGFPLTDGVNIIINKLRAAKRIL